MITAEQVAQSQRRCGARAGSAADAARARSAHRADDSTTKCSTVKSLALGLDVNDDEVRRRLIEKMQYLTEDLADPEHASEDAVRELYDCSPERFRIPALVSFEQVFLSPSARGDALAADADAGARVLCATARSPASVGDRTPLRERYDDAPRQQVDVLFGEALANALFTMAPGEWQWPVRIRFRFAPRAARESQRESPAAVRGNPRAGADDVRRGAACRSERRRSIARCADRYDVVIDWPEARSAVTLGRAAALLLLVGLADAACAHRLSPAFFGMTETAPNVFDVQWKVSISGGLAAALEPQVPEGCSIRGAVRTYSVEDVRFQHAEMTCPEGLAGPPSSKSTAYRSRRRTCSCVSTTATAHRRTIGSRPTRQAS